MKQLFTIIILATLVWTVQAQTSAVTVNSAGKIVVPANGTITSTGTITGNNIVSNLTLTAGNITTAGVLNLSTGNATAAASGNATGLTTGTVADARLSGNVIQFAKNNTASDDLRVGTGSATGTINADAQHGIYLRPASGRSGIQVVASDGTGPTLFAIGGGYGHLSGGSSGLIFQIEGTGDCLVMESGLSRFRDYDLYVYQLHIGGGTKIKYVYSSSASLDFASTASGSTSTATITVTGAVTTDTPCVQLGMSTAPAAGTVYDAYVSSANTVTVRFSNFSGSAVDPAAQTIRATVTGF